MVRKSTFISIALHLGDPAVGGGRVSRRPRARCADDRGHSRRSSSRRPSSPRSRLAWSTPRTRRRWPEAGGPKPEAVTEKSRRSREGRSGATADRLTPQEKAEEKPEPKPEKAEKPKPRKRPRRSRSEEGEAKPEKAEGQAEAKACAAGRARSATSTPTASPRCSTRSPTLRAKPAPRMRLRTTPRKKVQRPVERHGDDHVGQ